MRTYRQMFDDSRALADEWSQPSAEMARSSDAAATSYAQLVLQSLILIHGGALVAIPAWWPAIHDKAVPPTLTLFAAALCFVCGLFAAVSAGALGYFALANRSYAATITAREATDRAWQHLYEMEKALATDPVQKAALSAEVARAKKLGDVERDKAVVHNTAFDNYQLIGVGTGFLSMLLFALGTAFSMIAALAPRILAGLTP